MATQLRKDRLEGKVNEAELAKGMSAFDDCTDPENMQYIA